MADSRIFVTEENKTMASTPWSEDEDLSASQESSSLPQQLTPRSKIRALLAEVDDEPSSPVAPTSASNLVQSLFVSEGEEESDIEIPRNKSGRAQKMLPATTEDSDSDIPETRPKKSAPIRERFALSDEDIEAEIVPLPETRMSSMPPSSQPSRTDSPAHVSGSESDTLPDLQNKSRLMELVEKRRQAREAEEAEEAAKRQKQEQLISEIIDEDEESDGAASHKLSQHQRTQRRASKKALAQITQDQQRIERNLQLAHDARTRVKVTTSSLFAKFNFRQNAAPPPAVPSSDSNTSGSASLSGDTPPTSPMRDSPASAKKQQAVEPTQQQVDADEKGKQPLKLEEPKTQLARGYKYRKQLTQKPVRIINRAVAAYDDDSDLEIILPTNEQTPKVSRRQDALNARFARLAKSPEQAAQPRALHALTMLAHLHTSSAGAKNKVKQITKTELNATLQQRARQQAAKERFDRVEALKAKGIHVQTPEEKAKEEEEVEDLLAKARNEADALTKQEAEELKRLRKLNGEDSDSEEELDYSGSDEDESGDSDDDHSMIDGTADEASANELSDEEAEPERELEAELGTEPELTPATTRRPRKAVVISDDEDDITAPAPASSESVKKTPILGVPMFEAPPLGLTQIFAGTMGGSAFAASEIPNAFGSALPATIEAIATPVAAENTKIIADSQTPAEELEDSIIGDDFTDAEFPQTQMSEIPDASQDFGFEIKSPELARFTVAHDDSPVVQKIGRLLRKDQITEPELANAVPSAMNSESAFEKLKKGSKKLHKSKQDNDFHKKDSAAREMIDEHADESEDEWAGLGGASDDDSGDEQERAEEYAKLIDDADGNDGDAQELAAMMADVDRAKDEATVQQLYKDITTGALRRKRGQAFDLSDSEDDLENRRRMKRREFERMRKALMADEAVEKIANNPRKNAFMKCLEDREDLDFDFLEDDETTTPSTEDVSPTEEPEAKEASAPVPATQTKAPLVETSVNVVQSTNPRRTGLMAKPASLIEIKKTLSSLIEDPNNPLNYNNGDDVFEPETPGKKIASPRRSRVQVVDRARLKALNAAQQTSEAAREAFRVGGAQSSHNTNTDDADTAGPRLLLLRRSSTIMSNSSMSTNSSRSSSSNVPSVNGGDGSASLSRSSTMEGKSAKGGRSVAINYNAREALRKKAIEGKDKLRLKKKLARVVKERQAFGSIVGGGGFD